MRGNIVVTDQANQRVQIFNEEGEFLMKIPSEKDENLMSRPYSAVLDREGNLIIADRDKHQIQIWG